MAEGKKKYPRFTTPKGVAIFPYLTKPDTEYKAEGEYRVKLKLTKEAAAELIEKLEPLHAEAVEAAKKNPKNKGKKLDKNVQPFYADVLDDDGNETGEVTFNFKRTASGVSKKSKEPWTFKPDLFDAKGQALSPDVRLWGGSLLKVAFEVVPYDTPKAIGIKLSLAGVQVIKAVSGQRDASAYGFGDESDDEDVDSNDEATDESSDSEDESGGESGEGEGGDF